MQSIHSQAHTNLWNLHETNFHHVCLSKSQLSLIRIHIIRTFTNLNEIPRSHQNFITNSHGKTCIIWTSIIRTFTNPNTFCWPPQRKTLYNSNCLWIEKNITRILVIIVHLFFVIHALIYLHILLVPLW